MCPPFVRYREIRSKKQQKARKKGKDFKAIRQRMPVNGFYEAPSKCPLFSRPLTFLTTFVCGAFSEGRKDFYLSINIFSFVRLVKFCAFKMPVSLSWSLLMLSFLFSAVSNNVTFVPGPPNPNGCLFFRSRPFTFLTTIVCRAFFWKEERFLPFYKYFSFVRLVKVCAFQMPISLSWSLLMFSFLFSAVPLPMALFSLSGLNGTVDMSPNGATKAVSNNVTFVPGPFGNPNGSLFFSGNENSYVELTNNGQLGTRFSIGVFAWVHLHNASGPIYKHVPEHYGFSLRVVHSTLGVRVRFMERKTFKSYLLYKKKVLEADAWNFIGTTYDYHTGFATIFVNNKTIMQKVIKAKMELATDSHVRIGANRKKNLYFRGRIFCLQVYDQTLSVDQIVKIKTRCNQAGEFTTFLLYFIALFVVRRPTKTT